MSASESGRQAGRQAGRQTGSQTGRQGGRQAGVAAYKLTPRGVYIYNLYTRPSTCVSGLTVPAAPHSPREKLK